jgi:3-dehydroquinate synthase
MIGQLGPCYPPGRVIEIPVELGERRYTISVGHGALGMLPELLSSLAGRRIVVVSNARVWSLHGARIESSLRRLGRLSRVLIPDGERHKSWATLESLCNGFVKAGLGRDGLVVAAGGGVVGDVAGLAAAVYMRGVDWIQVPTTLLAMVDGSVGGKVAINHAQAKNLVGAFHQPRAVVSDPELLQTLPEREMRSGAYEVLKCAVLADRALFRAMGKLPGDLRRWGRADLDNAIASACRIKAEIVEKDERESGRRRVLNLGHTLGHALEAATGYRRFTHGEAVGWGLIGASWIARARGMLAESSFDAIANAVDRLGPRPRLSGIAAPRILQALAHDKKARAGRVPFILPVAVGRVTIRADVERPEVRRALRVMAGHEARLRPGG